MSSDRSHRLLALYAGLLTAAAAVALLSGAVSSRNSRLDTLDVQRINLREADGTLRLVISNKARFPGGIFKGREYAFDRDTAGMIFYNDEGTENGGLIFGGKTDAQGRVSGYGHLSFDQYQQDQVLQLVQQEESGQRSAGLSINDRPHASMEPLVAENAAMQKMSDAERKARMDELMQGEPNASRLFIGKNEARAALVNLKDAAGRTRLRLQVAADGAASIEFLDADGKVQQRLTPTASP